MIGETLFKKRIIIVWCVSLLFCFEKIDAQARLIINNTAFVNIKNGAFLVIGNSAANAITINGTTGGIISERTAGSVGDNRVKWYIGTTAATYTVPFRYDATAANYLPLTFTTSAAAGAGSIITSTYRTSGINSADLPLAGSSAVPLTMIPTRYNNNAGANNSAYGVDRFYQIDATDAAYTTKPTFTNIIFSYMTSEHDNSITANTITEANLKAQCWTNSVPDWLPIAPVGTVTTASNIVTVAATTADFSTTKWWSLVDNSSPLPVELVDFKVKCNSGNNSTELTWATVSETNNDYFEVEKSNDGTDFYVLTKIKGKGNSSQYEKYSYLDFTVGSDKNYYRLKQTDYDGKSHYSSSLEIENCNQKKGGTFFSAYSANNFINVSMEVTDLGKHKMELVSITGAVVYVDEVEVVKGMNNFKINSLGIATGVYFLYVRGNSSVSKQKIFINHDEKY